MSFVMFFISFFIFFIKQLCTVPKQNFPLGKIKLRMTFTFIHLADAFIQSDLQLLYMSEVARLWSN